VRILAVIPARWGSTRLPGKVLADINGKPMVRWIWENCRGAGVFSRVVVATDHPEVVRRVESFGGEAVLTDPAHGSGTERVAEVARTAREPWVVNVQGDEPFIGGRVLVPLAAALRRRGTEVATPVVPILEGRDLADPSVVKAVVDARGFARWFSRWPIPFARDRWVGEEPLRGAAAEREIPPGTWWRHLGIYAFRRERLLELVRLPAAPAEELERLEQLRWLHHGAAIRCVPVEQEGISIDTPADLERARRIMGAGPT
jgi:3-deoxy-manno-octulosonate cytidylyltransferase (CMP-KDO synthetase)